MILMKDLVPKQIKILQNACPLRKKDRFIAFKRVTVYDCVRSQNLHLMNKKDALTIILGANQLDDVSSISLL
jgi:hypothetical protein